MKVIFVALIVCHLFVAKSMASSAYGWSKNKGIEEDDNHGPGANSTGPHHHDYTETGSRRGIVQPTDQCYIQYFVGHQPPTGFRPPGSGYIKHICQQIPGYDDYTLYTTMFDERIGIAVYVGYGLAHDEVPLVGTFPRISKWFQNPGITKQGSNQMYDRNTQNIDKGHLVPAATYSFDCINMVSTFRYTNAVPQHAAFNRGPWGRYEDEVREFTRQCRLASGDLYLLTGTSEAVLVPGGTPPAQRQALRYFPVNNQNAGTNIAIPNSMWTAGCCMTNAGPLGGFAAIGNNVQANPEMHQVTVEQLQGILAIGTGGGPISLFPGNAGCSKGSNQYRYEGGIWTKSQNLK